mmetsp:Transcript_19273/g.19591  ORF Transcript_19273/g.19591 Transcript_19273/m.19591 type:complete len:97 (+) Transcript_19273:94-384(+)
MWVLKQPLSKCHYLLPFSEVPLDSYIVLSSMVSTCGSNDNDDNNDDDDVILTLLVIFYVHHVVKTQGCCCCSDFYFLVSSSYSLQRVRLVLLVLFL